MTLEELLQEITEKQQRLNELKAQSPEVAEALAIAEDYRRLYSELQARINQPSYMPMPCPVYPSYPYPWNTPPWTIISAPATIPPAQWITMTAAAGGK